MAQPTLTTSASTATTTLKPQPAPSKIPGITTPNALNPFKHPRELWPLWFLIIAGFLLLVAFTAWATHRCSKRQMERRIISNRVIHKRWYGSESSEDMEDV